MAEENDEPGPLQTATTEELIEELVRRHDAMIIARVPKIDAETTYFRWSGNPFACIGMAGAMRDDIRRDQRDTREMEGE